MRAVIYARYSSDLQRDASVEDQVRLCRELIEREGWTTDATYADRGQSGASTLRAGYQKLLEDARAGRFDVVVAEALDRLSRDQEDVAGLYKRLQFAGVQLVTISEGRINELHVGLKGTMNALFLKDLAAKTHRGLRGRVEQGKSGGGNAYGYEVVRGFAGDGSAITGERTVNAAEAEVVRRIFREFDAGQSPRTIALGLNRDGLKGPRGRTWGPSTLYGNRQRGTGILNNELYIGRLLWNRQRFLKDPSTGRRIARSNELEQWVIEAVPHLRIIDDELWSRVKDRQQRHNLLITPAAGRLKPELARRPTYLLSGLLKCGQCGGGFSKISKDHYGCSHARDRGTCTNRLIIRRDLLEQKVLDGLKEQLMAPELVAGFVAEYHRECNRLIAATDQRLRAETDELAKVEKQINALVDAIKDGLRSAAMSTELERLEKRKVALHDVLVNHRPTPPRLHPRLADVYKAKVADLHAALNEPAIRTEAAEILRTLIEAVRLVPEDGHLAIELEGDLAAILTLGRGHDPRRLAELAQMQKAPLISGASSSASDPVLQGTMVAGTGFEPVTFRL